MNKRKGFSFRSDLFYLHDLFGSVREVLFDLAVAEFEHLQFIRESCLSCLSLCEEVYDLTIRKSLFDILIVEVDNSVAVWMRFSFDTIIEDDFFLAILINALNFTIMTNILLYNFLVGHSFAVVLLREL